jgi:hypothetical protein
VSTFPKKNQQQYFRYWIAEGPSRKGAWPLKKKGREHGHGRKKRREADLNWV